MPLNRMESVFRNPAPEWTPSYHVNISRCFHIRYIELYMMVVQNIKLYAYLETHIDGGKVLIADERRKVSTYKYIFASPETSLNMLPTSNRGTLFHI